MEISLFDYYLPKKLIAQRPLARRGSSRLMVLKGDRLIHDHFSNFIRYLEKGDVLVLNDTKVVPAKLSGKKTTGGKVEILLIKKIGSCLYDALIRGRVREGTELLIEEGGAFVVSKKGGRCEIKLECKDLKSFLARHAKMPLPPYIRDDIQDSERYQTVYAKKDGSLAAPTAGLHFSQPILHKIRKKGVKMVFLTLHIGPATFTPVRASRIEDHEMEAEYFQIDPETAEIINSAFDDGGRIFVVGTTTLKALESACEGERVKGMEGWSKLFIYPSYNFKLRIDALLTNFHLPKSTPLILVSAFAGRERIMKAYQEAIRQAYRFYSLGDAMLIMR